MVQEDLLKNKNKKTHNSLGKSFTTELSIKQMTQREPTSSAILLFIVVSVLPRPALHLHPASLS